MSADGGGEIGATIRSVVSPAVVAVEVRHVGGPVDDADLFDVERAVVAAVAPGRHRDFVLGRRAAHEAMRELGVAPAPLLPGSRREPLWPAGVAGAITHCEGYVAAAVARTDAFASIGIDAEPDAALPEGVDRRVLRDDERVLLSAAADVHVDRLVFSAKEAVYKAWFPLARRWLGFHDARLELDVVGREFEASLLVDDLPIVDGRAVRLMRGRWAQLHGVVVTVVEIPASTAI